MKCLFVLLRLRGKIASAPHTHNLREIFCKIKIYKITLILQRKHRKYIILISPVPTAGSITLELSDPKTFSSVALVSF